jgi:hypothetical protein
MSRFWNALAIAAACSSVLGLLIALRYWSSGDLGANILGALVARTHESPNENPSAKTNKKNSEETALQKYQQAAALAEQAVSAFESAARTDNSALKLDLMIKERSLWKRALRKLTFIPASSALHARSLAKQAQYERLLTTVEDKLAKANEDFILGIIQDANVEPEGVHITLCQIENPQLEALNATKSASSVSSLKTKPAPPLIEKGQLNRDRCRHHQGDQLMASPASLIKIPIAIALAHKSASDTPSTVTEDVTEETADADRSTDVSGVSGTDTSGPDTSGSDLATDIANTGGITTDDITTDSFIADSSKSDRLIPEAAATDVSTTETAANTDRSQTDRSQKLTAKSSVSLDQKIFIDPGNFTENAEGAVIEVGQEYSLRKVMSRMIIDSDNIATNQLIDYLGYESIERSLKQLGYSQTLVGHKLAGDQVMPANFGNNINQSSTHEITAMMAQIYAFNTPANRDIMAALRDQADRELGYEALTGSSPEDSSADISADVTSTEESGPKIAEESQEEIKWLGEKTGQNTEVLASTLAMSVGSDYYILTVALDYDSNTEGLREIIRGIAEHLSKVGPLLR